MEEVQADPNPVARISNVWDMIEQARADRAKEREKENDKVAAEIGAIKESSAAVQRTAAAAITLAEQATARLLALDKKTNDNAEAIQELRTGLNKTNDDWAETKNISQRAVQTTVELRSELQTVRSQVQILESQKFETSPEVQRLQ